MIFFFFLVSIVLFYSCNLCPTGPAGNSSNHKDYIYSTLIPINSNEPIITKISVNSFNFSEIASNGYIFSAPAQNGNFSFIRVDTADNKKILMLGNLNSNSFQILEKENKDFSIFNPRISVNGDKIAFLGGSNQLYIWVLNPETNASYIDKVSNNVYDNAIPTFSPDGALLAFLEKSAENTVTLRIVESSKPDNTIYSRVFDSENLKVGIDNYLSFSADLEKIAFITQNDTNDIVKIVNYKTDNLKEIKIKKENFGIKIAKISPDGKYIAVSASDGNLWGISLMTEEPLFSKLSNVTPCNSYLYFDWNADGTKLLAQNYNCNDDLNKGSTLYVVDLMEEDNLLKTKNISLFCNNIQRAFWGN